MTPETVLWTLLAGGLLVCQYLTLRILKDCHPHLSEALGILRGGEPHFQDMTTNFGDVGEGINESLMEIIRIGSDVADQIDNLSAGAGAVASPAFSPQVDIQSTIMSLIADKFLTNTHGDTTQQERNIQQENDTPTPSVSE
tara:strand:+ start:552 stop:974 length:423 start_codon:yes stop_codon:yes gene_type:complete